MNRTLLILGTLDRESNSLRRIMLDTDCTVIRFSEPERWRDSLNQDELGAAVISSSVDAQTSEIVRSQIEVFEPAAKIIVQPSRTIHD